MKNVKRETIRNIAITASFVAVIAVSAQITVPLPSGVPVTLQTMTIALCGYCLGLKKSLSAVLIYLFMGLVGLPVFSGFSGGIPSLFGRTGGFIIGFIFLVFACGMAESFRNRVVKVVSGTVGLLLCHLVGVLWYSYLTQLSPWAAFLLVSMPFLVKDLLCVVGAALVSGRIVRAIPALREKS